MIINKWNSRLLAVHFFSFCPSNVSSLAHCFSLKLLHIQVHVSCKQWPKMSAESFMTFISNNTLPLDVQGCQPLAFYVFWNFIHCIWGILGVITRTKCPNDIISSNKSTAVQFDRFIFIYVACLHLYATFVVLLTFKVLDLSCSPEFPVNELSPLLCLRNRAPPGWTASSVTLLTSFSWRTRPPSKWRWLSWWKNFQIYGKDSPPSQMNSLEMLQPGNIYKTDALCTGPSQRSYILLCLRLHIRCVVFGTALKQEKCKPAYVVLLQWIKTRKRSAETYLH